MDLSAYPYRSTFTSVAKVIVPTSEDRFLAKASLSNLKGILPPGINPDDNPDILYVAFDGAVAGMVNKNSDALTAKTALAINHTARYKFISVEHKREDIVGVILHPAFSRFGSSEPLTDAEAAELQEPFNMSYVGALWKVVNPMLANHISQGGSDGDLSIATSWEIAFKDYAIGYGSKNLWDCTVVKAGDPDYTAYAQLLRSNGGDGKDRSGNNVFRIIDGDAVILGYSVVVQPAAEVAGILPLDGAPEPAQEDASAAFSTDAIVTEILERFKTNPDLAKALAIAIEEHGAKHDSSSVNAIATEFAKTASTTLVTASVSEKTQHETTTLTQPRVNPSTPMITIKSKEELAAKWNELRQNESCAAVTDFLTAIEQGATQHMAALEAANNLTKAAEASAAANAAKAAQLEQSMAQIQAQLDEVRASADAAAAQAKYTERMASFDDVFDLGDEERKLIAKEVLSLDSDEAFAACLAKYETLMAAKKKSKGGKPNPFEKKDGDKADDKKDMGKDDSCASTLDVKAAVASVTEIPGQTVVPNTVTLDASIQDQMKAAFGPAFKINGKTAAQK